MPKGIEPKGTDKDSSRHEAAIKAWKTIKAKKVDEIRKKNRMLEFYEFDINVNNVSYSSYKINPPLIKPSKLTSKEKKKNSSDKDLSDGYAINYAIGCTHACRFCYVDSIHKRFTMFRLNNDIIARSWGMYLLIPSNIDEAIEKTDWSNFKGKEVLMSSTHDPYLPQLVKITRKILEVSLPYGVRYCIQTRSTLILKDLDLLAKYKEQVRIQVSIATLDEDFARIIEPRVPSPRARLNVLKEAKKRGLKTGVIIAPLFPTKNWILDMESIFKEINGLVDNVYGECFHIRGANLEYLKEDMSKLGIDLDKDKLREFDKRAEMCFNVFLKKYNMQGKWWREYHYG